MENNQVPLIVLGAEPLSKISVSGFFEEENDFFNILKNPPYLRYSGWNLLTLDYPRIREGKCWEVRNGDRKTIRIYEDGSFVAIAYADNSFLGWGKDYVDFVKDPKLPSLAVIEYLYEFVEVYRKFLEKFPGIKKIAFSVGTKNVDVWEGKKLVLRPTEIGGMDISSFTNPDEKNAIEKDFLDRFEVDTDTLGRYDSKYVAFQLVSRFFIHFNIPTSKIPYTKKDGNGVWFVDIDKIIAIR